MRGTDSQKTIDLHIVSAEGGIYSGPVRYLIVRAVNGELGIHPNHAALLTRLTPGELRYAGADDGEEDFIYISGGMLEVQPFVVTVLADTAKRGTEIDEAAALEAKKRAESIIREGVLHMDRDAARIELMRAIAQLRTLEDARARLRKRGHG